jgi:signal transduction histidine kinase
MAKLLRALLVEDSEIDAQLLLRELQQSGYVVEYERVETRAAMQQSLSGGVWDVVLCDYSLPQFNAVNALRILKESGIDIPFIVISGTIQEEAAVNVLKAGAHDFIVKGRFSRLAPAIDREVRDAEIRRAHRAGKAKREELTADLESISAELERFLYIAFHELRSPLVTIKGFLGKLAEDIHIKGPDQISDDIHRISGAVDKLNELLSDLLKLSQIERVRNPWQEVDLLKLTLELVQLQAARIDSKHVRVSVSPHMPSVYGDADRLREALENLIENAARHMGGQQNPLIEIGVGDADGQQAIFVKDNGMGIDPRYHDRIFNLFEKLDPISEGSGVGLAIVKRIVEIHGGRIWVESEGVGKGSTFYFTLSDGESLEQPRTPDPQVDPLQKPGKTRSR